MRSFPAFRLPRPSAESAIGSTRRSSEDRAICPGHSRSTAVTDPADFAEFDTFHPTFLYEALLNLSLAGLLIILDRRKVLGRGQILPLWIAGYGVLRFIDETIRTDPASLILGIRVNHWISGIAVVGGLTWFRKMRQRAALADAQITGFEDLAADDADLGQL